MDDGRTGSPKPSLTQIQVAAGSHGNGEPAEQSSRPIAPPCRAGASHSARQAASFLSARGKVDRNGALEFLTDTSFPVQRAPYVFSVNRFLMTFLMPATAVTKFKQSLRHSQRQPLGLMGAEHNDSSAETAETRSEQRAAAAITDLLERWHLYLQQRDSHRARHGEAIVVAADVSSTCESTTVSRTGASGSPIREPFRFNALDPLLFEPPACNAAASAAQNVTITALRSWALRHQCPLKTPLSLLAPLSIPPAVPSAPCHTDAICPELTVAQFHRPHPHMRTLRANVQRWRRAESDRIRVKGPVQI
jgi:hypothetical protein